MAASEVDKLISTIQQPANLETALPDRLINSCAKRHSSLPDVLGVLEPSLDYGGKPTLRHCLLSLSTEAWFPFLNSVASSDYDGVT
jgi:hypothetical protein